MLSLCLLTRWVAAAAQRLFGPWGVFEIRQDDVAWPSLRDYPYGPPTR
jgi:hypothetical protein